MPPNAPGAWRRPRSGRQAPPPRHQLPDQWASQSPRAGPDPLRASDPTDSHHWSPKRNSPPRRNNYGRSLRVAELGRWRADASSRLRRDDHGTDRAPAPDRGAVRRPGPGARGRRVLPVVGRGGGQGAAAATRQSTGTGMPPKPYDRSAGASAAGRDRRMLPRRIHGLPTMQCHRARTHPAISWEATAPPCARSTSPAVAHPWARRTESSGKQPPVRSHVDGVVAIDGADVHK